MSWPTILRSSNSLPRRSTLSRKVAAVLLNDVIKNRLSTLCGINIDRVSTRFGDITVTEHRLLTGRGGAPDYPWDRVAGPRFLNRKQASRQLKGRNDHKF